MRLCPLTVHLIVACVCVQFASSMDTEQTGRTTQAAGLPLWLLTAALALKSEIASTSRLLTVLHAHARQSTRAHDNRLHCFSSLPYTILAVFTNFFPFLWSANWSLLDWSVTQQQQHRGFTNTSQSNSAFAGPSHHLMRLSSSSGVCAAKSFPPGRE